MYVSELNDYFSDPNEHVQYCRDVQMRGGECSCIMKPLQELLLEQEQRIEELEFKMNLLTEPY